MQFPWAFSAGSSSQNSSRLFLEISAMPFWPWFWLPSGPTWKKLEFTQCWFLATILTAFQNMPAFFVFLEPPRVFFFSFPSSIHTCYSWVDKLLDTHYFLLKAKLCTLFLSLEVCDLLHASFINPHFTWASLIGFVSFKTRTEPISYGVQNYYRLGRKA